MTSSATSPDPYFGESGSSPPSFKDEKAIRPGPCPHCQRAKHRRYNQSDKGRDRNARYESTPAAHARKLLYEQTVRAAYRAMGDPVRFEAAKSYAIQVRRERVAKLWSPLTLGHLLIQKVLSEGLMTELAANQLNDSRLSQLLEAARSSRRLGDVEGEPR